MPAWCSGLKCTLMCVLGPGFNSGLVYFFSSTNNTIKTLQLLFCIDLNYYCYYSNIGHWGFQVEDSMWNIGGRKSSKWVRSHQNIFHVEWAESMWNSYGMTWIPHGIRGQGKDLPWKTCVEYWDSLSQYSHVLSSPRNCHEGQNTNASNPHKPLPLPRDVATATSPWQQHADSTKPQCRFHGIDLVPQQGQMFDEIDSRVTTRLVPPTINDVCNWSKMCTLKRRCIPPNNDVYSPSMTYHIWQCNTYLTSICHVKYDVLMVTELAGLTCKGQLSRWSRSSWIGYKLV